MPRNTDNCGCHVEPHSIYGPGGLELCDFHAARTCADCGATDELPYEDGLCPDCAPETAECDYCHTETPKKFMDNGAICFSCLERNWREAEHEEAS